MILNHLKNSFYLFLLFISFNTYCFDEDKFILGKSFFDKPWVAAPASTTARDGLGPLFNARSCLECHPKNGRGNIKVITLNNPNTIYGGQIATHSNNKVKKEADIKIINNKSVFTYPNGEQITLTKPEVRLLNLGYGKITSTLSIRTPPKLFGIGDLAKITPKQIKQNLKSGGKLPKGRFGLSAENPTLIHQVANAAFNDMSLTSPLYPQDNCTNKQIKCLETNKSKEFDLPQHRLEAITYYVKNIKSPKNTKPKNIFIEVGCANCHIPKYNLYNKNIYPYTDLLLHNLGDGYFRTAPLWGINTQQTFMHDNRAKTVEEAILWHNGNAKKVKLNFINLDKKSRIKLINFVKNL